MRLLKKVIVFFTAAFFITGFLSSTLAYQDHSNLRILVYHNAETEARIKTKLKEEAPDMAHFIDSHRVLNVFIRGTEIFCINEFVVYDTKGEVMQAVMLLYNSSNERVESYCHPVNAYSYGVLFIPASKSIRVSFLYKGLRGESLTQREIEI